MTILSRSLTKKGERIRVSREFGSRCEDKITEKKVAQQVKHDTSMQLSSLLPRSNEMG